MTSPAVAARAAFIAAVQPPDGRPTAQCDFDESSGTQDVVWLVAGRSVHASFWEDGEATAFVIEPDAVMHDVVDVGPGQRWPQEHLDRLREVLVEMGALVTRPVVT